MENNIFNIFSNFKSPISNIFVKYGCSIYLLFFFFFFFFFFLNSANLICRGTDISKYFIDSFGIRDNESRLYIFK